MFKLTITPKRKVIPTLHETASRFTTKDAPVINDWTGYMVVNDGPFKDTQVLFSKTVNFGFIKRPAIYDSVIWCAGYSEQELMYRVSFNHARKFSLSNETDIRPLLWFNLPKSLYPILEEDASYSPVIAYAPNGMLFINYSITNRRGMVAKVLEPDNVSTLNAVPSFKKMINAACNLYDMAQPVSLKWR